jgi:GcrA cell cycle regulator
MVFGNEWNAEQMARLQTLHREGVSFGRIAADIGVTRGAVVGKARRMHLPARVESQPKADAAVITQPDTKRRRIAKPRTAKISMSEADAPATVPGRRDHRRRINDLDDRSCRFPLWQADTPHEQRFYCGVPGAIFGAGVPYCRHHAALCRPPRT